MTVKLLTEYQLGVSKLKRRLHRFVRVYICQNATLLEIMCGGSNVLNSGIILKIFIHENMTGKTKSRVSASFQPSCLPVLLSLPSRTYGWFVSGCSISQSYSLVVWNQTGLLFANIWGRIWAQFPMTKRFFSQSSQNFPNPNPWKNHFFHFLNSCGN